MKSTYPIEIIVKAGDQPLDILNRTSKSLRKWGLGEREILRIEESVDPSNIIESLGKWVIIR